MRPGALLRRGAAVGCCVALAVALSSCALLGGSPAPQAVDHGPSTDRPAHSDSHSHPGDSGATCCAELGDLLSHRHPEVAPPSQGEGARWSASSLPLIGAGGRAAQEAPVGAWNWDPLPPRRQQTSHTPCGLRAPPARASA